MSKGRARGWGEALPGKRDVRWRVTRGLPPPATRDHPVIVAEVMGTDGVSTGLHVRVTLKIFKCSGFLHNGGLAPVNPLVRSAVRFTREAYQPGRPKASRGTPVEVSIVEF